MARRRSSHLAFWPAALLAIVTVVLGVGAGLWLFQKGSPNSASPATSSTPTEPPRPQPPAPAPKAVVPPPTGGGSRTTPEGSRPGARPAWVAQVAVIFDDAGGDLGDLEEIIAIGRPVTVAVLPGLRFSRDVADRARAAGLEVFLHVPLEAIGSNALGPGGITVDMSDEEIAATVRADLATVPGAVGLNNHMGSLGTADERVMRTVLQVAKERGLIFVDSLTSGRSVAVSLAEEMGVPAARRNVFLDNEDAPGAIRVQFRRLAAVARRKGSAIGIGHAHRLTPKILKEMLPEFDRQGIQLVLVSMLVK